jgi:hypothetical protein
MPSLDTSIVNTGRSILVGSDHNHVANERSETASHDKLCISLQRDTNVANFTSAAMMVVMPDFLSATANETARFEQPFLASYNQPAALDDDVCDSFFGFESQADLSLNWALATDAATKGKCLPLRINIAPVIKDIR